ncbi:MAG TPA: hypothetical protein EYG21_04475, partial [Nitrospinaceae bacterium]|nr:hypothetical protein [Nitrospinaceae bacterium]
MKLTKSKLKRIIKEEIENIQNEGMMDKLKSLNPFGKKEESGPVASLFAAYPDLLPVVIDVSPLPPQVFKANLADMPRSYK